MIQQLRHSRPTLSIGLIRPLLSAAAVLLLGLIGAGAAMIDDGAFATLERSATSAISEDMAAIGSEASALLDEDVSQKSMRSIQPGAGLPLSDSGEPQGGRWVRVMREAPKSDAKGDTPANYSVDRELADNPSTAAPGRTDNRSTGSQKYYSYRDERDSTPSANPPSAVMTITPEKSPSGGGGGYFRPADNPEIEGMKEAVKSADVSDPQATAQSQPQGPAGQQVAQAGARQEPAPEEPAPAVTQRKIIRSGDIEFEVDSFDLAVERITKIADEEKGFLASVNSEKLPNGKMRGTVIVRCPPERLDTLVLKLRALGDIKGQRIGTQDVTKHYTDLESRLRAARAMEARLLEIIRSGKGEIKDLLAAEKELGTWRTRIEEIEGELRYYNNLIALSTLNITLQERDVRSPFALIETEQVDLGIEVEDVEKAQKEAHQAITEVKGRITKSELKQHSAGQFQAIIHCEAAPEVAGQLRDRLKQLGEVTRLEVNRLQKTEGPQGRPQDVKVERSDAVFHVSLYNVVNVAPRMTVQLSLAVADAESAYKAILERVQKAGGRIVTHRLDRQRNEQTTGLIHFEVKTNEADAVETDIKANGEVMRLQKNENLDAQNVTRSKHGFQVQIWALGAVAPREKAKITLVTRDVPGGYEKLQNAILASKGRILHAELNEQDRQNIWAKLDFDVRRNDQAALLTALNSVGEILTHESTRASDAENTVDSKRGLEVRLINAANVAPRETVTLALEVNDVEQTIQSLVALLTESKGRIHDAQITHERSGRIVARQIIDVPLSTAPTLIDKVKTLGTVRLQQAARDRQAPEGNLAVARLDITLSNQSPIVARDEGLMAWVRWATEKGVRLLTVSLASVLIGVLFVGPWALVGWASYRLTQRFWKKEEEPLPPPAASETPETPPTV